MRIELVAKMKLEIERKLKAFLRDAGVELIVAANDNVAAGTPAIEIETMEDTILSGNRLLFEIKVVLGLLRKPWMHEELIKGIYYARIPIT